MNFDNTKLFDILTSGPWDNGTGRKMLFLKRRYYVFDDDHTLLDGGVIHYNKTLEKIFIRNEDLRGEVFLSLEGKNLHLQGAVYSKLAGQINIDNILSPYEKKLQAPLSRVAKVERYLRPKDIYEILQTTEEIDEKFLKTYQKSLHSFTQEQARQLYIKISPHYFKNFEIKILKTIALYFSTTPTDDKLYEELFMFIMGLQTAYENGHIKSYDINLFISYVKECLLASYEKKPSTISINMINETLLYFNLSSIHLPSPRDCVEKLYDKDLRVQQEYAYYLSLMDIKDKEIENDVFKRLLGFYQEKFFDFQHKLKSEKIQEEKIKKVVTELGTQLALIKALGNCKSNNSDVHLFLLFLLSNNENRIQDEAKSALIKIEEKAIKTFELFQVQKEYTRLLHTD